MRTALALLALIAFAVPALASHCCTGSANCRVCTDCSRCRYCRVPGHHCGVCAPGKKKAPTKPSWRRKHPRKIGK